MPRDLREPDIVRPEYCKCEVPWSTVLGPLGDGSHYTDCVAEEVEKELDRLKGELDAALIVVKRLGEQVEKLEKSNKMIVDWNHNAFKINEELRRAIAEYEEETT